MKKILSIFFVVALLLASWPVGANFANTGLISVSRAQVNPRDTVTLSYSGGSGLTGAWIGLYKSGAQNNAYTSFQYINTNTSGTLNFEMPYEPGIYEFRMFRDSAYTLWGTGPSVTVVEFAPTVSVPTMTYYPKSPVVLTYSGTSGFDGSWIGLYKTGAADNAYATFQYINKNKSGTLTFEAPYEPGTYEFRVYKDSGYRKIGQGGTFTVTEFSPVLTYPTQVTPSTKFDVSYSGASGFQGAWIGLFPKGSSTMSSFQYTNTNKSGTLTFTAPATAGIYELKVYKDSGYRLLKTYEISIGAGAITPPQTGINLSASPTATGIQLSWNAPSTAPQGYNIYRRTTGSYGATLTDFYVKTLTYLDQTVDKGTTYHYIVKPVLANGTEGPASNEVSVLFTGQVAPVTKTVIDLKIDDPFMVVSGVRKEIDPGRGTAPIILNGRTVLPIGAVIEALGGTIGWLGTERKVTIEAMGSIIELWVDQRTARVNGVSTTIDVPPVVLNGRTMVPLRFITENLNCTADWDGANMSIRITSK